MGWPHVPAAKPTASKYRAIINGSVDGRLRDAPDVLAESVCVGSLVAILIGVARDSVVIAVVALRPAFRPYVLAVPAGILVLAGAYIVVQQWRYGYPPVFEWPTLFGRVRTPAWIAVMILAGDAILSVVRDWPDGDDHP